MKRFFTETALFLVLVFLCPACTQPSRRHVNAVLDDVESYINDRSDSALAVLEGVDTTALTTRALRARYSLLRVMALDKCFLAINAPGLLDPVVEWYDHHGSVDEKLKTLYYQGRVEQDNKDLSAAIVFYSRAEQLADKVQDKHAVGLLYDAISSLYNTVYNTDKELEYVEKELAIFKQTNDPMYQSALGRLALVYHTRKEWRKADSLYNVAISNSGAYPHALSVYMSNYARMKLLQPEKDPAGAIELLNKKRELTRGGLTPQEAGSYAYASELLGERATTDLLVPRLQSLSENNPTDILPWLSRIAMARGDYELAYQYQTEAHLRETAVIQDALSDTVTQALKEDADVRAKVAHSRLLWMGSFASAICFALFSLVLLGKIRRHRIEEERNRLLRIRAELEQDLKEQEARTSMLSDSFSSRLAQLRLQLKVERLERLRKSGQYGYWIWMEKKGRSSDANVTKALRKDLQDICALEKDSRLLECRLDKELDGIVSHLKADLNIANRPKEVFFLCCWLIGLKPDMIAELLNLQMSNVYVKTHRLEERIRRLGKAEYAPLVKE